MSSERDAVRIPSFYMDNALSADIVFTTVQKIRSSFQVRFSQIFLYRREPAKVAYGLISTVIEFACR
jgi:hypothetical protein